MPARYELAHGPVWDIFVKGPHTLHVIEANGRCGGIIGHTGSRKHFIMRPKKNFAVVELKKGKEKLIVHPPNQQMLKMLSPDLYGAVVRYVREQEMGGVKLVDSHPSVKFGETNADIAALKKKAWGAVYSRIL
ncbi:MAG: hypothetical protein V1817_02670 [Candidatus Micrarchaeota archaeon]